MYLIFEGFAINRHDIDKGSRLLYRELTDNGRRLKRLGSLKDFWDWEKQDRESNDEKKILEHKLLKSQNDFQELNNQNIKQQQEYARDQIQTNKLIKITNVYIAIFTGVAGEYYISELLRNYIPLYTPNRTMIIYLILLICLAAGIFGYLRMRRVLKRKLGEDILEQKHN